MSVGNIRVYAPGDLLQTGGEAALRDAAAVVAPHLQHITQCTARELAGHMSSEHGAEYRFAAMGEDLTQPLAFSHAARLGGVLRRSQLIIDQFDVTASPNVSDRHRRIYGTAARTLMDAVLNEARPNELVGVVGYHKDTRSPRFFERVGFRLPDFEVWGTDDEVVMWTRAVRQPVSAPVPQPRAWPVPRPRTV